MPDLPEASDLPEVPRPRDLPEAAGASGPLDRPASDRPDPAAIERRPLPEILTQAAQTLQDALDGARAAHRQYARLVEADRSWARLDERLLDEIRLRRADAALSAAGVLTGYLRAEADAAQQRYPHVDAEGRPLPPRPASDEPVVVRDWWAGLTPAQKELLLQEETAWVGGADGLPVPVRHAANLRLLDAEIARRDAVVEAVEARPGQPRDAAAAEEERDLRGLHKLREMFAAETGNAGGAGEAGEAPGPAEPTEPTQPGGQGESTQPGEPSEPPEPSERRYLYLLDATVYPLKAAIVLGDLEAADAVVLHVPGATTTVDLRLARETQWMRALVAEADRLAGSPGRVAVVDWIGYHAPYDIATRRALGDSGVSVLVPGEASDERYARDAAPVLARCAQGLRALRPRPVRLVVSGHSYGASVVGLALAGTGVFDAAVVAGSPGLFTSRAADLRLPPDRLFAAIAPGDLIAFLGVFGGQVIGIDGVRVLSPFARRTTYPDGRKSLLRQVWGHESYYQPGSAILHQIAAVVIGADDALREISVPRLLATLTRSGDAAAAAGSAAAQIDSFVAEPDPATVAPAGQRAGRPADGTGGQAGGGAAPDDLGS